MWSYRVSFGVRYVLWQPSHAYATARNCLRNASPSDGLVVDNFSASICNFLAFPVKSSHCCQTTGFAAVGNCVLPGGNFDVSFPEASLIARASAAIRSSSLLARSRLLIASKRFPMSVINSMRSRTAPVACSWPLCARAAVHDNITANAAIKMNCFIRSSTLQKPLRSSDRHKTALARRALHKC